MKRLACGFALVVFFFVVAVPAQTAKQGDAASLPADPTEFHSPMVLETAFAAGDRTLWNGGKAFSLPEWWELGKYKCDGVSVRMDPDRKRQWDPGLEMRVRDVPGQKVEVKLEIGVRNPKHNLDKMVDLFLEVMNGEEVIGSKSLSIKAKDNGEGNQEDIKWTFPANELHPSTKLRITMKTRNY